MFPAWFWWAASLMTRKPALFLTVIAALAQRSSAGTSLASADEQKACYLITDQRDWGGLRSLFIWYWAFVLFG